jgi:hypothetical protein
MSYQQNKTLARRWLEEVMNKKKRAAIDELFATNFVDHDLPPGRASCSAEVCRAKIGRSDMTAFSVSDKSSLGKTSRFHFF